MHNYVYTRAGKERQVVIEILPYILMLYPGAWSLEILKVVNLRNEWASFRDRYAREVSVYTMCKLYLHCV